MIKRVQTVQAVQSPGSSPGSVQAVVEVQIIQPSDSFPPPRPRGRIKVGVERLEQFERFERVRFGQEDTLPMTINDSNDTQSATDIDLAYCRAALYSALAMGFQAPTEETLSRLLAQDSRASLADAAAALYPNGKPDLIS